MMRIIRAHNILEGFVKKIKIQPPKALNLNASITTSRLLFSSAEMFKKTLANSVDPE